VEKGSFSRARGLETIQPGDPQWKHLVALSLGDLRSMLRQYGLGCEKWRSRAKLDTADNIVAEAMGQ
jgi:hypothetical protein